MDKRTDGEDGPGGKGCQAATTGRLTKHRSCGRVEEDWEETGGHVLAGMRWYALVCSAGEIEKVDGRVGWTGVTV